MKENPVSVSFRVWLKRIVGRLLFTSFLLTTEDGRQYAVTVNRFGRARARWSLLPVMHVNCRCGL